MKWLPIEEAPKDGTPILVYPPTWTGAKASVAKWDLDEGSMEPRPFWK